MISVCIATFNGEKFIHEQLNSLLGQLSKNDEVIVVDDCSSDSTLNIIQNFQSPIIKVFSNPENIGPCSSFSRAIELSKGDLIYLCDQDDVWAPNKIQKTRSLLTPLHKPILVSHSFEMVDSHLNKLSQEGFEQPSTHFTSIIVKNRYVGATLAFNKSLKNELNYSLMKKAPMHDWWIALVASLKGTIKVSSDKLLLYRRHERTVTKTKTTIGFSIKGLSYRIQLIPLLARWFFNHLIK